MACLRGRRWTWGVLAGLGALSLAGCLSTNPAGLRAPTETAVHLPSPPVHPAPMPPVPRAEPPPPPSATPSEPQPAGELSYFPYIVRKGDTLYALARRYHVTVEEIEQDNHITSPTDLPIGKLLVIRRVPGAEAPPSLPSGSSAAPAPSGGQLRPVAATVLNRGKPAARFWWPTGGTLARRYGTQYHGFPDPGIAISAPAGTQVYAVADGKVISVVLGGESPQSAWGNVVSIEHADDMTSWYGHLARVLVKEGARVSKGEAIGTVGRTGQASEPELAFRLYHDNRPVDPLKYLP